MKKSLEKSENVIEEKRKKVKRKYFIKKTNAFTIIAMNFVQELLIRDEFSKQFGVSKPLSKMYWFSKLILVECRTPSATPLTTTTKWIVPTTSCALLFASVARHYLIKKLDNLVRCKR